MDCNDNISNNSDQTAPVEGNENVVCKKCEAENDLGCSPVDLSLSAAQTKLMSIMPIGGQSANARNSVIHENINFLNGFPPLSVNFGRNTLTASQQETLYENTIPNPNFCIDQPSFLPHFANFFNPFALNLFSNYGKDFLNDNIAYFKGTNLIKQSYMDITNPISIDDSSGVDLKTVKQTEMLIDELFSKRIVESKEADLILKEKIAVSVLASFLCKDKLA